MKFGKFGQNRALLLPQNSTFWAFSSKFRDFKKYFLYQGLITHPLGPGVVGGVVNSLLVAIISCCFVSVCVLVSSALSSGTALNFIFASDIAVALETGSSLDVSTVIQPQQSIRIWYSQQTIIVYVVQLSAYYIG